VQLETLVAALDRHGATTFEGVAYRHVAAGRDPLSGEGARLAGGRWNPPLSFAVLYLALEMNTAVAEFHRLATKQGLAPADFLPRELFTYRARLQRVADLRDDTLAEAVGLSRSGIRADAPSAAQAVGQAAHHAGFEAILAPSAACDGAVLAVFLDRLLADSRLKPVASERWNEVP
jgi:RES domain-containing protein